MDVDFDAAMAGLHNVDQKLKDYLKEVQAELQVKQIVYVSVQKDSHLLEIPEVYL